MSFQATLTYAMACTAMSVDQIKVRYDDPIMQVPSGGRYLIGSTVDEEAVVVRDLRVLLTA